MLHPTGSTHPGPVGQHAISSPLATARSSGHVRRCEPMLYALSGAFTTFRHRFLRRDALASLAGRMLRDVAHGSAEGPIRLVDVGCAQGGLVLRIADRLPRRLASRLEPIGIEISSHLVKLAHTAFRSRGGHCIQGSGVDGLGSVERGSAHVIVLSGILEHEASPLALLRRCRERLALDGRIVVKVPNHGCLDQRVLGRRHHTYRWPDHANHFTPQTLTATARAAGLRIVRMNAFDRWPLSDSLHAVLGRDASAALETIEPVVTQLTRKAA